MAQSSSASSGTIFGLLAGVVVLAGIVGAPFYAGLMRSDAAALSEAVSADVAVIQRAVAAVQASLDDLGAVRSTPDGKLDAGAVEGLSKKPAAPSLDALMAMFRRAQGEDERRGTKLDWTGQQAKSAAPDARTSINDSAKLVQENKELLAKARKASSNLDAITRGSLSAKQHIGVLTAQSALHLTEGRLSLLRASWERQRALSMLAGASAQAQAIVEMNRAAAASGSAAPTEPLDAVAKRIEDVDGLLARLGGAVEALEQRVGAREAELKAQREAAAAARTRLAEMDAKGFETNATREAVAEFQKYEQEYRAQAEIAARAEAAAEAIENGTITGGTLSAEAEEDIRSASYEGGKAEPGLRDLRVRLATGQEQVKQWRGVRAELEQSRTALQGRADELAADVSRIRSAAGGESDRVEAVVAAARKHTQAAVAAAEAAARSFAQAADLAAKGQAQAKRRSSEAAAAAGSGEDIDERLDRIGKDTDTEAGLWFAKGEADYYHGLALAEVVAAVSAQSSAERLLAQSGGLSAPAPADEAIQAARSKGLDRAAASIGSFDQWIGLTRRLTLRTPETTIQGKDLVWQGQVAKAASLLLKARLEADEDVARGATSQADELLREAVQGREQSPLLQEALATLVYLQKTAD